MQSSTIGNYLIPNMLGVFADKYPEIELSLTVGNTEEVIRKLQDYSIDVGFIEGLCRNRDLEC